MNIPRNAFIIAQDTRPFGLDLVVFQRTNADGYAVNSATFEDGKCIRALHADPDTSAAFLAECNQALKA